MFGSVLIMTTSLPAEGKHKRSYNASLPVALHLALAFSFDFPPSLSLSVS